MGNSFDVYDVVADSVGAFFIVESNDLDHPAVVLCDEMKKVAVRFESWDSCDSAMLLSNEGEHLLVLRGVAYGKVPMVAFLTCDSKGNLVLLTVLGGDEWRTRASLSISVCGRSITVTGLDPKRTSLDRRLQQALARIRMTLLIVR